MAEGFARYLGGGRIEAYSAGIEPKGVNPYAVRAMFEVGIDISAQTSKPIDPELLATMDLVVTLCGDAAEKCPYVPPTVARQHWPLPDPAIVCGTDDEKMTVFRKVRDEIRRRVSDLLSSVY